MTIDDILNIATQEEFDRAAMEVFRRQAAECEPYREYLGLIGVEASGVGRVGEIPFLPIELFKTHRVYCGGNGSGSGRGEPEAVFTSSATGGEGPSRHYISRLADYDRTYMRGFELFYGPASRWSIYALLPSYLEREGSSLVRMADGLIGRGREAGRGGGFYLRDHTRLLDDMRADPGPKILLGVSYALLDLAEELAAQGGDGLPADTIVMETGGMKGQREEMPKERMHAILGKAFGVGEIHSEYGMAELMSQAYSSGGNAHGDGNTHGDIFFRTPPWMQISVRNLADPFEVRGAGNAGRTEIRGGVNIIDLANLDSCAFIQTQDVGRLAADGSFALDGRVARSDIRGCNLLVQ